MADNLQQSQITVRQKVIIAAMKKYPVRVSYSRSRLYEIENLRVKKDTLLRMKKLGLIKIGFDTRLNLYTYILTEKGKKCTVV